MRKIIIFSFIALSTISCRNMSSTYESRLAGIHKVCPNCTYVQADHRDYAQDTSKQPNLVYIVYFCKGAFYDASTVDHLIRVN